MIELIIGLVCIVAVVYYFIRVPELIDERNKVYDDLNNYSRHLVTRRAEYLFYHRWKRRVISRYTQETNTYRNFINPLKIAHWRRQLNVMIPDDVRGRSFKYWADRR